MFFVFFAAGFQIKIHCIATHYHHHGINYDNYLASCCNNLGARLKLISMQHFRNSSYLMHAVIMAKQCVPVYMLQATPSKPHPPSYHLDLASWYSYIAKAMLSGFFLGGGGGGGGGHLPPLGDPKKNCSSVNVLAFCSYLLQIPIRVILTCQVSFLIALDVISEHLKFKIFWGGRPPRPPPPPPKSLFEVHRILHTKFTWPPLKTKIFHFAPPWRIF